MDDLVPFIAIAPKRLQDNVIQGGGQWSGAAYGQGNLSRLIFDMSKAGLLSTRLDVHRDVILISRVLALGFPTKSIGRRCQASSICFV